MPFRHFPRANPTEPVVPDGDVWNDLVSAVEWCANLKVAAPLDLANFPGGRLLSTRQSSEPEVLKLTGDLPLGGGYKAVLGVAAGGASISLTNTGSLSLTSATTLGYDFSNTNNQCVFLNASENGLSVHVLPTNGSTCVVARPLAYTIDSTPLRVFAGQAMLPPTLACSNTASAGSPPLYTLRRVGDPSGPPVATGLTPWRPISIGGFTGTNLSGMLTPATLTHWMPSGTGVAMTICNEQLGNHPCGTNTVLS